MSLNSSKEVHLTKGSNPGESVTPGGFVVPDTDWSTKGIKDRFDLEPDLLDAPLDEEPSNSDTILIEDISTGVSRQPGQPRRVRTTEAGVTERLVKREDGSLEWEAINAEREVSNQDAVLEELARSAENSEENDSRQDKKIEELNKSIQDALDRNKKLEEKLAQNDKEIADLKKAIEETRLGVENMRADILSASSAETSEQDAEGGAEAAGASDDTEATTGNEVVKRAEGVVDVYPKGKEVEVYEGFRYEIPEELVAEVNRAMADYANETARARKGYLGQLLQNSKLFVKIPGVKKIADKINGWADKKLDASREAYRTSANNFIADITSQYESAYKEEARDEAYEQELRTMKMMSLVQQSEALEISIVKARQEQSGKAGWFTDKLTNGESLKGKFAVAGVAGAVGLAAGFFGGRLGGALAGGVTGAIIGGQVNRRRANSTDDAGETLAFTQSREDKESLRKKLADKWDDKDSEDVTVEDVLGVVDGRTASERQGNRSRLATATGIGAAAGAFTGGIGDVLSGTVGAQPVSPGEGLPDPNPNANPTPPADIAPDVSAEVLQPDPSIGNYDYPWDWAADKYGSDGASDVLKRLGEIASQDGHSVQWNGEGYGEWVQVDGVSDTQSVLNILSRYTGSL